jgi:hypothetical protein
LCEYSMSILWIHASKNELSNCDSHFSLPTPPGWMLPEKNAPSKLRLNGGAKSKRLCKSHRLCRTNRQRVQGKDGHHGAV